MKRLSHGGWIGAPWDVARRTWIVGLGVLLATTTTARAQTITDQPLVVGVKPSVPFVMKDDGGQWFGASVFLWEKVAGEVGLRYELREVPLAAVIPGIEDGTLDVAVGALTITAERERRVDFTHPFYEAGLGIAVRADRGPSFTKAVKRLSSPAFWSTVWSLALLLLVVGVLVWLAERRRNPDQFGGRPIHGIGSGFWWSAVTMTTVGYGDKAPVTTAGRLLALVWMFAGLIAISGLTASLTTSLTVTHFESSIESPDDLVRVRVGALDGSTSAEYLSQRHIGYTAFESLRACQDALASGEIDAIVHDTPILLHMSRTDEKSVATVLPIHFEPQQYGFVLPQGSELREPLNRALLTVLDSEEWTQMLKRFLGD